MKYIILAFLLCTLARNLNRAQAAQDLGPAIKFNDKVIFCLKKKTNEEMHFCFKKYKIDPKTLKEIK